MFRLILGVVLLWTIVPLVFWIGYGWFWLGVLVAAGLYKLFLVWRMH